MNIADDVLPADHTAAARMRAACPIAIARIAQANLARANRYYPNAQNPGGHRPPGFAAPRLPGAIRLAPAPDRGPVPAPGSDY